MRSVACAAAIAVALCLAGGCGGRGDQAPAPTLFERLGGVAGLRVVVDEWVGTAAADPRIQDFFVDADVARLKLRLVERLCVLAGGPCVYRGRDLDRAHAGMGLRPEHVAAFVADLEAALTARGVDEATRDELVRRVRRLGRAVTAM